MNTPVDISVNNNASIKTLHFNESRLSVMNQNIVSEMMAMLDQNRSLLKDKLHVLNLNDKQLQLRRLRMETETGQRINSNKKIKYNRSPKNEQSSSNLKSINSVISKLLKN